MKKALIFTLVVCMAFVIASCKNEPEHEHSYENKWVKVGDEYVCKKVCVCGDDQGEVKVTIGMAGPAGGLIFAIAEDYSAGYRYLEVAPQDVTVGSTETFMFGYYRKDAEVGNLFINDSKTYDENCTGTAVGKGAGNTRLLVETIGSEVYTATTGEAKTANYAAKLAYDYTYGGYDDWFLPSKDELNLLYTNLGSVGLGGFNDDNYYWSSSEGNGGPNFAWQQRLSDGVQKGYNRDNLYRVRCIRAF